MPSRRTFVKGLAFSGAAASLGLLPPPRRRRAGRPRRCRRAGGHRVRPAHRPDAGERHRPRAGRAHDQRLAAGPAPALARGRHGDAARVERARRRHVDPLARHPPARQHGRRPRSQLRRHPPRRDLHVSLPRAPGRHLLVPLARRLPGAAGRLWAAGDRAARAGAVPLRPRARGDAHRLDRRGPAARVRPAQEAERLLQHPPADARRLGARREARRAGRDARRAPRLGGDADEPDRPRRRRRLHLHLPDERAAAGRQLDRAVHARRARPAAADQRIRDVVLRRAHPGREADGGRRRWPAGAAGDGRRAAHRRRRDLRRDRRAGGRRGVHDHGPGHGPHRLRRRHAGRPRRAARRGAGARSAPGADDGGHGPRARRHETTPTTAPRRRIRTPGTPGTGR